MTLIEKTSYGKATGEQQHTALSVRAELSTLQRVSDPFLHFKQ